MRPVARAWLVLVALCVGAGGSEENFRRAMDAVAAGDYATALSRFEAAVASDPENLRYGSEYRQAVIRAKEHDRCLKFFEKLVADRPKSAGAYLNYGFAHVDKIPTAGSISQLVLANAALAHFTRSIELHPDPITYYTRGNAYLYWPRVFGRTALGVADLEEALNRQQQAAEKRHYHVRVYIALGDAYWKLENREKARAVWKRGLAEFPGDPQLKIRLDKEDDELNKLIEAAYDPDKRVDTNLRPLWENPDGQQPGDARPR